MRKIFPTLAAMGLLAGCAKPVSQMDYVELRALSDKIKAKCSAEGAGPGTPEWKDCASVEANFEVQSRDRQQAAAQAAAASMGQTFSNLSAQTAAQAAAIPVYQPPMIAPRQQLNCSSTTMAWETRTTCY